MQKRFILICSVVEGVHGHLQPLEVDGDPLDRLFRMSFKPSLLQMPQDFQPLLGNVNMSDDSNQDTEYL